MTFFTKRFGIEVKLSSDGWWQVTNTRGVRFIDLVSFQIVKALEQPTVLKTVIGPVCISIATKT